MNSKVLLLGQIAYIRELQSEGVAHGLTEAEAWAHAMDHAEEIALEPQPIATMIFEKQDYAFVRGDQK